MSAAVDVEDGECDFCGERGAVAVSEQHRRKASICRECLEWAQEQFAQAPKGTVVQWRGPGSPS